MALVTRKRVRKAAQDAIRSHTLGADETPARGISIKSKLIRRIRDQWKGKAGRYGDENRYFRKELRRVKTERDRFKHEALEVAQHELVREASVARARF